MKLVIELPYDVYKCIKKNYDGFGFYLYNAVREGEILCKGHGRLIDADNMANAIYAAWKAWKKNGKDCQLFPVIASMLLNQRTIVEADGGNAE